MTKNVKVFPGMSVMVHDADRPQHGNNVHPALVTKINDGEGNVNVKVIPEDGVAYPIRGIHYRHGDNYIAGKNWYFPEEMDKKRGVDPAGSGGGAPTAPQASTEPTPGAHEPIAPVTEGQEGQPASTAGSSEKRIEAADALAASNTGADGKVKNETVAAHGNKTK